MLDTSQYILANLPTTATTAFTFSGSYSPGNAVVITLASASGISAADEIFISDGASSEFTKVQSVSGATITVALANSHSNVSLYRIQEGNYFQYQKQITILSNASDIPVLPGETHLDGIGRLAAAEYYADIEEPDRAAVQEARGLACINDAWLAWGKTEAGPAGQMVIG